MAKTAKKPEHKPSKKVALDEVLASLQDLVQNEFADENDPSPETSQTSANEDPTSSPNVLSAGSPKKTTSGRKRGRPPKNSHKKEGLENIPDQSAMAEDEDYTYSQVQADLFSETPVSGGNIERAQSKQRKKPVTKTASKPVEFQLETDRNQASLRVVGNKKPAKQPDIGTPEMANKSVNTAEKIPDESGLNWASDIPVLTEAVDPEEFNAAELEDVVKRSLESENLSPEARQIAVKVAAKLNIEMRESGGEQLDIKTIMRLQALLKEALEPKD